MTITNFIGSIIAGMMLCYMVDHKQWGVAAGFALFVLLYPTNREKES